jgi:hypothetical protein
MSGQHHHDASGDQAHSSQHSEHSQHSERGALEPSHEYWDIKTIIFPSSKRREYNIIMQNGNGYALILVMPRCTQADT